MNQLINIKKNARFVLTKINEMPKLINIKILDHKTEAELRLSMSIVEHNIALRMSDHLVQLIKNIPQDVAQNLTCNRTKATALVNNVIGKFSSEDLISRMQKCFFSILVDESTDHSSIKHLAIIVRIVDTSLFIVRDEFACLKEISHATAQNIFNSIIQFFNENNISYKQNLIGYASDGANAMFGIKNSIKTLLEEEVPGLFVMKCICHSLALCCSHTAEKLPNFVEDVVRDV